MKSRNFYTSKIWSYTVFDEEIHVTIQLWEFNQTLFPLSMRESSLVQKRAYDIPVFGSESNIVISHFA